MSKKKPKDGRGGHREGAGRKPTGNELMVTRSIRVYPSQWERWRSAAAAAGVSINQLIRDSVESSIGDGEENSE